MKNELTQEDYKNILSLIGMAPIKGSEALPVALLQQKITMLLQPSPVEDKKVTSETTGTKTEKK